MPSSGMILRPPGVGRADEQAVRRRLQGAQAHVVGVAHALGGDRHPVLAVEAAVQVEARLVVEQDLCGSTWSTMSAKRRASAAA